MKLSGGSGELMGAGFGVLATIAAQFGPTEVVHRGFPDGRFTACGIDRENTDEPVVATMQGQPTLMGST